MCCVSATDFIRAFIRYALVFWGSVVQFIKDVFTLTVSFEDGVKPYHCLFEKVFDFWASAGSVCVVEWSTIQLLTVFAVSQKAHTSRPRLEGVPVALRVSCRPCVGRGSFSGNKSEILESRDTQSSQGECDSVISWTSSNWSFDLTSSSTVIHDCISHIFCLSWNNWNCCPGMRGSNGNVGSMHPGSKWKMIFCRSYTKLFLENIFFKKLLSIAIF